MQYFYRLEGLDNDWVPAGPRRVINYNSLRHAKYRFDVRAELPEGPSTTASYDFEMLPQFWETMWFRVLCAAALLAAAWAIYQLRLRQMRLRFALVLEERARLAREIHDTLAQASWASLRSWTRWRCRCRRNRRRRGATWTWRGVWRGTA